MSERPLPRTGSSSGPMMPPGGGQHEDSPLSHLLRSKADEVKTGMKELTAASQVLAAETRSINTENERYKGSVVDTAVSAMTSQTDVINGADPNQVTNTRQMSGAGGTIKIEPTPAQSTNDDSLSKSKSIAVQSILGGVGAAINLSWIAYFGTDMPAELYAAVPVFVQLVAQGVATAYNNRGSK